MPDNEITITFLEMRSPGALRRAAPPPRPLGLERLGPADLELFRDVCLRIGEPYGWSTRPPWSTEQWTERLESPAVEVWLARCEDEVVGLAELEFQPEGKAELVVFGLLPEFVGRGLGGTLLTRAVERAWSAPRADDESTRCVWLHTSSFDHPHALENYLARGFRIVRSERRTRPD